MKITKIMLLVAVLGIGYYFYHSNHYYTIKHFGMAGFGGATNKQLQEGDSLLLDKKAYAKRLPERGEVIAYRNPKVPADMYINKDPLGYSVGVVIGFPGEDMECMLGDKIILANIQEATGDVNTPNMGVSIYNDRLLVRGLKKELADRFYICLVMRYDKMILGSPSIDNVYKGFEIAKVVAVTAPSEHKKKIQKEDIAIIN